METRTKLLLAALLLFTGCDQEPGTAAQAVASTPAKARGAQIFAKGGIALDITGLPISPVAKAGPFSFRVSYGNVPAGAGLYVAIVRDGAHPEGPPSGGMLSIFPIGIVGTGVTTMDFAGKAASAPADSPEFFPVHAGHYRIVATLYSTREGRLGFIPEPKGVRLAEYRSTPIVLSGA
jgi:hypothetical protein